MQSIEALKNILGEVLSLGTRAKNLNADSPLLGSLPELDSMAVIHLIATLEDHFGISVEDDEINAKTFETLGHLANFVDSKLAQ